MDSNEVRLEWRDGRRECVSVPAGQSVLEAAEAAGIGLPFGCRTGACATCVARCLEGELSHRRPPRALKRRHHDAGYVLACIAEPETDCTLEVGSAVQRGMVSNPWK